MYMLREQFLAQLALFAVINSLYQRMLTAGPTQTSGINPRRTGRRKPNLKKRSRKT